MRMGRLAGGFNNLTTMSGISFTVRRGRLINLVNPGNTNGAAFFGLLANICIPARNAVRLRVSGGGILLGKGTPCGVASLNLTHAFRGVHLFGRLAIVSGMLVTVRDAVNRDAFRDLLHAPACCHGRTRVHRGTLRLLTVFRLRGGCSILTGGLPCNRRHQLRVIHTLTASPGVLFLSRPTTNVGPRRATRLATLVHGVRGSFGVAIILVRRSVSLIVGIYREVCILRCNHLLTGKAPRRVRGGPTMVGTCLKNSWHTRDGGSVYAL